MKKRLVPCYLFNSSEYKYPNGLRVENEDDRAIKIKAEGFNTGPVDMDSGPTKTDPTAPKEVKEPYLKNKGVHDLIKIAEGKGIAVDVEWSRAKLIAVIENQKEL